MEWRPRATDRFLELLCLAVYIIGGQLARGLELLSDKPKIVARFLPKVVGQLVTAYLLYLRPGKAATALVSDYLWANDSGPWDTDRLIPVGIGREVVGERFTVGYNKQLDGRSRAAGASGNGDVSSDEDKDGEDLLEL
ncbi:hypothetical protein GGP41_005486 [Bipolaris sorokiniana]|uniref:Uncharacterized protein n=1 Tax=Cochliobolus sativus TaxID=45130 RepID=A0A8H5ZIS2_COCSA|nr:hypothetical protein GGP41_005486 [Bipolaris sorokiniana]